MSENIRIEVSPEDQATILRGFKALDAMTPTERAALLDALARLDGLDFDGPDCE